MKLKTLIIFRIKTTSRANAHSQAGRLAGAGALKKQVQIIN